MKVNLQTGFWIRLLARMIDLMIFAAISVGFALINLHKDTSWYFKDNWFFYIWMMFNVLILFVMFILLPVIFNGQTLGMFITRIKISFEDNNKLKSILKRELFFSITWIILVICVGLLINHTLFVKYAKTNQKDIKYTNWENLRISIVTTIASLLTLMQMVVSISVVVRKPHPGIHDSYSKTKTVWVNKFTEVKKQTKDFISIKPRMVKNEKVEWL